MANSILNDELNSNIKFKIRLNLECNTSWQWIRFFHRFHYKGWTRLNHRDQLCRLHIHIQSDTLHFLMNHYNSIQPQKMVWEQLIRRSGGRSDWVDDIPTTSSPTSAPTSQASWHHWHSTSSMIMSSAQILLYKPAVRSQPECPD